MRLALGTYMMQSMPADAFCQLRRSEVHNTSSNVSNSKIHRFHVLGWKVRLVKGAVVADHAGTPYRHSR